MIIGFSFHTVYYDTCLSENRKIGITIQIGQRERIISITRNDVRGRASRFIGELQLIVDIIIITPKRSISRRGADAGERARTLSRGPMHIIAPIYRSNSELVTIREQLPTFVHVSEINGSSAPCTRGRVCVRRRRARVCTARFREAETRRNTRERFSPAELVFNSESFVAACSREKAILPVDFRRAPQLGHYNCIERKESTRSSRGYPPREKIP